VTGGGDNTGILNTDGTEAKQITKERFLGLVNNAGIGPVDRGIIFFEKAFYLQHDHFGGRVKSGCYHKNLGKGIQLNKKKNEQQDVGTLDIPRWQVVFL